MATPDGKKLTDPQALVLFVIWRAREQARLVSERSSAHEPWSGLTIDEITDLIRVEFKALKWERGASYGNVKRIVGLLHEWNMLEQLGRAGHSSMTYEVKRPVVRWASTAAMLLELARHDFGLDEAHLAERMTKLDVKNPDGTPFPGPILGMAMEYCLNAQPPYLIKNQAGRIEITGRVVGELAFLKLLSRALPS